MARFGMAVLLVAALSACNPSLPPQPAQPGSQGQQPVTPVPEASAPPQSALPDYQPENSPGPFDQLVIPGQRVGPITAQTSRADLVALYGEAALADGPIAMGEGTTAVGTVVNPGTDQAFAMVWPEDSRDSPELVKDFGPAWKTPEGLGIGSPFSAVKTALGDFQLYGFAWDYGGTVVLAGTRLDRYDGHLWLRLAPAENALEQHPEAYQAVMGDGLFSSDDPNLDLLDLSIYELVVYFGVAP